MTHLAIDALLAGSLQQSGAWNARPSAVVERAYARQLQGPMVDVPQQACQLARCLRPSGGAPGARVVLALIERGLARGDGGSAGSAGFGRRRRRHLALGLLLLLPGLLIVGQLLRQARFDLVL